MSVYISGSLAYDNIMDFPGRFGDHIMPKNIHILSVGFLVKDLRKTRGGTAGNIAYTMGMLGGDPLVFGTLGRDGAEYLRDLRAQKISAKYIVTDPAHLSASAYVIADKDDNQITAFYNGIAPELTPSLPKTISGRAAAAPVAVIAPSHKKVMQRHAREAKARGMQVMFDPGQQTAVFNGAELRTMIAGSHFVIGNDYEIKLILQRTGWTPGKLLEQAKVLVTTLGAKGSQIETADGKKIRVPAARPRAIKDPTGAGDAYRAGFLAAYQRNGADLKAAAQAGSVVASFAIEHVGTQEHRFSKAEFGARYKKTYGKDVRI